VSDRHASGPLLSVAVLPCGETVVAAIDGDRLEEVARSSMQVLLVVMVGRCRIGNRD
jgi:hypothetical protein